MKICYFVNNAAYFVLHWIDRVAAMSRAGHEVHLMAGFPANTDLQSLAKAGVICHPLCLASTSFNPFNLLRSMLQANRLLKTIRPDLMHCITLKPCLNGVLLASRFRTVLSFPGLGRMFCSESWLIKPFRRLICRWLRRAATQSRCLLTFEHDADRQRLCRLTGIPLGQTRVIGASGVDPERFYPSPHPRNTIPVILFAARLIRTKGLDTLVNIGHRLRQDGLSFTLMVAGLSVEDDPDAIPLEQMQQWMGKGDIQWTGTCYDMPALLEKVDIVALPTRYAEGIPRILLEAAACGRPGIAFDRGGCRNILKNNECGLLIPDGDEEAFYRALRALLENAERCALMGINGRKRVMEAFTSEHAIRHLNACYDEVMALSTQLDVTLTEEVS